jgi:hypothetical protein
MLQKVVDDYEITWSMMAALIRASAFWKSF